MFDIGLLELLLIGVVGLLVIGPERLPAVARNVGRWVGRVRHFISNVKDDIDREIRAEELKKAIENNADLEEIKRIIHDGRFTIEDEEPKDYVVKATADETDAALDKIEDDEDDLNYGLTDHNDYGNEDDDEPVRHENKGLSAEQVAAKQERIIQQHETNKHDTNEPIKS